MLAKGIGSSLLSKKKVGGGEEGVCSRGEVDVMREKKEKREMNRKKNKVSCCKS